MSHIIRQDVANQLELSNALEEHARCSKACLGIPSKLRYQTNNEGGASCWPIIAGSS